MPLLSWYDKYDESYFLNVVEKGISIYSSGSSGEPKLVYQPAEKVQADAKNAQQVQCITENSRVYTCLDPQRSGCLFAQTIPALLVGADVDLVKFNAYDYVRQASNYTHTHLTPKQAKAVMLTKGFKTLDLSDKTFLIGSEPVTYDIINAFVECGATVITIWGMTEIGVNAILHRFDNLLQVAAAREVTPANSTILGNIFYCDWRIDENNCLWVRGDICVYDDWFNTQDQVIRKKDMLYYTGRTNAVVDFDNPRKG